MRLAAASRQDGRRQDRTARRRRRSLRQQRLRRRRDRDHRDHRRRLFATRTEGRRRGLPQEALSALRHLEGGAFRRAGRTGLAGTRHPQTRGRRRSGERADQGPSGSERRAALRKHQRGRHASAAGDLRRFSERARDRDDADAGRDHRQPGEARRSGRGPPRLRLAQGQADLLQRPSRRRPQRRHAAGPGCHAARREASCGGTRL